MAPITLESKVDRTPEEAAALPHQGRGLTLGPGGVAPLMGSGTDRQTGRAGVRKRAVPRSGPGLLKWSWDQIRTGPGAGGRGRAG